MFNRFSQFAAGDFQIVVRLQIQPHLRACAEVASKPQGSERNSSARISSGWTGHRAVTEQRHA